MFYGFMRATCRQQVLSMTDHPPLNGEKKNKQIWNKLLLQQYQHDEREKRVGENWGDKNLHITFIINVSSKAELGSLGLDPSHLSFVPSSDGIGRKVNIDVTVLLLVELEIWK
jgi:hypothetical protein